MRHRYSTVAAMLAVATTIVTVPVHGTQDAAGDLTARLGQAIADWNANLANLDAQPAIAQRFVELTEGFPASWEAAYWASHAHTQLFAEGQDTLANMHTAQEFLDRARESNGSPSDRETSDFHMMQALIHSNMTVTTDSDTENARLRELEAAELAAAEAAWPDNPRVRMFKAFALIRAGDVDRGRIVFTEAIGKFDAYPSDNPLYPDWGRRWIDFWLGGMEKRERR